MHSVLCRKASTEEFCHHGLRLPSLSYSRPKEGRKTKMMSPCHTTCCKHACGCWLVNASPYRYLFQKRLLDTERNSTCFMMGGLESDSEHSSQAGDTSGKPTNQPATGQPQLSEGTLNGTELPLIPTHNRELFGHMYFPAQSECTGSQTCDRK